MRGLSGVGGEPPTGERGGGAPGPDSAVTDIVHADHADGVGEGAGPLVVTRAQLAQDRDQGVVGWSPNPVSDYDGADVESSTAAAVPGARDRLPPTAYRLRDHP